MCCIIQVSLIKILRRLSVQNFIEDIVSIFLPMVGKHGELSLKLHRWLRFGLLRWPLFGENSRFPVLLDIRLHLLILGGVLLLLEVLFLTKDVSGQSDFFWVLSTSFILLLF